MKIVYVYDAIARVGGVERILIDKMNYLAEKCGYNIYLITAAQGMHPISFPLSHKVKHIDINARFHLQYQYSYPKRIWIQWSLNRQFKKRFEKQIKIINPDIIIGTTWYKGDVICKLKCKAKKIIESHSARTYTGKNNGIKRNICIEWIYNKIHSRYEHIIEKKSNAIVSLTEGDAMEWKNANFVCVIPNMINYLPQLSSSCRTHRVISAGRLTYQKGFDRLIKAWKYVYQKHPDWILDIYGTGELEKTLNDQIIKAHLQHTITINPSTTQILEEFTESSIYVMSSHFEGFPMVLIEAMSCGIPCISFDLPYGPSDIITDSEDGILVENNNIQALATAVCFLIEYEDLRIKYGKQAKKNIEHILPQYIMPKWIDLFNTITEKK